MSLETIIIPVPGEVQKQEAFEVAHDWRENLDEKKLFTMPDYWREAFSDQWKYREVLFTKKFSANMTLAVMFIGSLPGLIFLAFWLL